MCKFWILDFGDFGDFGFWILDLGDFGFWIVRFGGWKSLGAGFVTNFGCYIRKEDCARRPGSADFLFSGDFSFAYTHFGVVMMFWFFFDRHFHTKQLPLWWMIVFTIHWFPLISHCVAQLDLPCHQVVFWTRLRLRQWSCSRLCWCPVCKEAVVSGKWFAHWQCILCWQSLAAFTVWWINPVDRLTSYRCDTLWNNILKQLLYSQPDITWKWFPSTPG